MKKARPVSPDRASPSRKISSMHGTNQVIAYAADNDDGRDGPKQ